jgi:lysophospholipase L1-like esterase
MHPYTSFVALGDSFTEGLDDPGPDGMYRGWADLVAARLAAEAPGFTYANLAVRGRLLAAVVDEQLPPALEMGADLVSFAAGANDAMRRHFDVGAISAGLDDVVARIRATGATLVMFTTAADLAGRLPAGRVLRRRLESLNDLVRTTAAQHGALVVEGVGEHRLADPRMWSIDRIHLSTHGHRLVAAKVVDALGVTSDPAWTSALDPLPPVRWLASRTEDLRWFWRHAGPWVRRRVTGQSSGDAVRPKRPALEPMTGAGDSPGMAG